MVDGEDEVLLDGPHVVLRGLPAGEHPQVVGGKGEVRPGRHGSQAVAQPVGGGQDGGHHGTEAEGLGPALLGVDVQPRGPAELGAEQRHGGAENVEG